MKIESKCLFFLALGVIDFDFREKNSSDFMESKTTTNFDARRGEKIGYPPDLNGLSRAVEKQFGLETNFKF